MKRSVKRTLIFTAGIAAGIAIFGKLLASPGYQGPRSDHFDGEKFHNLQPTDHGFGALFKWMATRERGKWPAWIDAEPGPKPVERVGVGELVVTRVNHATVLIQFDGVNILTDPMWSERASPVQFAGPKRHRAPGIRFEDLPPIDAVVVSHNHYDHMDLATLQRVVRDHRAPVFVGLGNGAFLRGHGIATARDFDWWDEIDVKGMKVICVPAQHFSARGFGDRDKTLWAGWAMRSPTGGTVFFAGDTGYGPHFRMIGERFPDIRLALLPIGAFLPRWFMSPVHTDPEQAVLAHKDLRAKSSIAMHYGTFALGDDALDDPPRELEKARLKHNVTAEQFRMTREGDAVALP
jgi:L-ascorbate metabolism protein UlaG (beta-lactamase superfamily)